MGFHVIIKGLKNFFGMFKHIVLKIANHIAYEHIAALNLKELIKIHRRLEDPEIFDLLVNAVNRYDGAKVNGGIDFAREYIKEWETELDIREQVRVENEKQQELDELKKNQKDN